MPSILERLRHGWEAFVNNKDPTQYQYIGPGSSLLPSRSRFTRGNDRTLITAIFNRIAVDGASVDFKHVRVDDNGYYMEDISSRLNEVLSVSANIDQTGRAFIQDAIASMLDEGHVALVPVETTDDPIEGNIYDISTMRTARVVQWYPKHVRVNIYNERTGQHEEITLPKKMVAIVENPFYSVMNEPNSTLKRLLRKLVILDAVDEQSGSGKLDMIIQLPYVIKTEARRQQAESRRRDIEQQLAGSKFGIAYTDGTERITQLNRSLDNNLLKQVEYLTETLYSQLGLTKEILDGTASEAVMQNYYTRTIEPILTAIAEAMNRTFLTKTARTQKQRIIFIRNPFKLVPVNGVADMADKFTRNEIMSSNEIRRVVGLRPVNDPKADELRNKNLNAADSQSFANTSGGSPITDASANGDPNTKPAEPIFTEDNPPSEEQFSRIYSSMTPEQQSLIDLLLGAEDDDEELEEEET